MLTSWSLRVPSATPIRPPSNDPVKHTISHYKYSNSGGLFMLWIQRPLLAIQQQCCFRQRSYMSDAIDCLLKRKVRKVVQAWQLPIGFHARTADLHNPYSSHYCVWICNNPQMPKVVPYRLSLHTWYVCIYRRRQVTSERDDWETEKKKNLIPCGRKNKQKD